MLYSVYVMPVFHHYSRSSNFRKYFELHPDQFSLVHYCEIISGDNNTIYIQKHVLYGSSPNFHSLTFNQIIYRKKMIKSNHTQCNLACHNIFTTLYNKISRWKVRDYMLHEYKYINFRRDLVLLYYLNSKGRKTTNIFPFE